MVFSDGENLDDAVAKAQQAEIVISRSGEKRAYLARVSTELGLPAEQEALLEAIVKI